MKDRELKFLVTGLVIGVVIGLIFGMHLKSPVDMIYVCLCIVVITFILEYFEVERHLLSRFIKKIIK